MRWLNPCLAAICLTWVFGFASAQDRAWASSIAWSPDGQTIAVGGGDGVWFFDNDFNELGFVEVEHPIAHAPRLVKWNATGDLLVHSSFFSSIKVVDVNAREVLREIEVPEPGLWAPVHWHPKENQIIGGTYQETTHIWDAITGEELFYFESPPEPPDLGNSDPLGFCWHTGNEVAIVTALGTQIVDIVENKVLHTFPLHFGRDWASCNDEYQILTPSGWLIDLPVGQVTKLFDFRIDWDIEDDVFPLAVSWSPRADQFVSSLNGCRIRVYSFNGRSSELVAELSGGAYYVPPIGFRIGSIGWHPDGSRLAAVGDFGDIRVWDAETYELLQQFDGFELHPGIVSHLDYPEQALDLMCP